MDTQIHIRQMTAHDIDNVFRVFDSHDIGKSMEYITKCFYENETGTRITLLAFYEQQFAGTIHLLTTSGYPYFAANGIPEINDFNVIPPLRRKGIGSALMDTIEASALQKYGIVGIGVGLLQSYGSAQRLYAKRGYVPDGRGVVYCHKPVAPGSLVPVDDDLNLFFTKTS